MKKLLATIVSMCMIVTAVVSPMGTAIANAAGTTVDDLITTGNEDLYDADGNALQDDTYQYGVSSGNYYAFMWVPESAEHLNGLMVAKSNLIEPRILESVTVRNVLAKYNIGVLYVHSRSTTDDTITADWGSFNYTKSSNTGAALDEMLAKLAAVSGYDELLYAPLIGVGHSAGMGLGQKIGSWDPERAIAQICMKGWPGDVGVYNTSGNSIADIQPGVPTYLAQGQWSEHCNYNDPGKDNFIDNRFPASFANIRGNGTDRLLSASVEWETGHYEWGEQSNEAVANYLDNIIPARLGEQATSQNKIAENYTLTDLTDSNEAYVADIAMYGKRNVVNAESTYAHGLAKDFTDEEQKTMVWFVNEEQYQFVRDFTVDRKNVTTYNGGSDDDEEEDTRVKKIATSYDRSYNIDTGNFSEWPSGNICFYVADTQEIAYEFDISALTKEKDSLDTVTLSIPHMQNNASQKVALYQVENPWDTARKFTVPEERTLVAENLSVTNINVDITEIVQNTTEDMLYFVLKSYENGSSGSDFYAKTRYDGYSSNSYTDDESQMAHLNIGYKTVYEEKPSTIYTTIDRSYNKETGNFSEWPSGNICVYISDNQEIAYEFDISELAQEKDSLDTVTLSIPHKANNESRKAIIYQIENPWDTGVFTVPVNKTIVAEDLPVTNITVDITELVKNATGDKIYFVLGSNDTGSGSDFYSGTMYDGYKCDSYTEDQSKWAKLTIVYTSDDSEDDGKETGIDETDKHQYLRLEDPGKGVPKELSGTVSRYGVTNPGDVGFQNGIEGDPNTFSMVVDKMNQVTCDHYDTSGNAGVEYTEKGTRVNTSDNTPAYIVPTMAPVEWIGVKEEELNNTDAGNHVASKWRNYMRWKNNRVYYHMASQDQYMAINAYDVYNEDGELQFSRGIQAFQIYGPTNQSGTPQVITFADVPNYKVSALKAGVTLNPTSSLASDGYKVDLMVDYGPLKVEQQDDGSYTMTLEQLPAGATYPIECKLVATQFGSSVNSVRRAEPVEKVFYIYEDTAVSAITESGAVNTNEWKMNGITGFNVEGAGTVTLGMANDTIFNAKRCADISTVRANSTDAVYKTHYQYPAGYNPYDYWQDYPGTWTAEADNGFVSLGDFVSGDRTNIDLTYINTIRLGDGITKITPVISQTEVVGAKANAWGYGVNIVWQKPHGAAYDTVTVYNGSEKLGETTSADTTNLVVQGLEKGEYTLTVKTIKGGTESTGVDISAVVDGKNYLVDDFEGGDLTSGLNWVNYAKVQSAYAFSSYMGESLTLLEDDEDNHYLGMQCTYGPYIQTTNVTIPGGLTPEMSKLVMDIKVDKLENQQGYSNGQVYFEFYNPTTGRSYSIDRGDDFALEDKEWHEDYTLSLSDFKLPTDAETLAQITVLRVGRKTVGGGYNNRRGKIYLDNITLSEVPDYTIRSFTVEKVDEDETDGKADLVINWAKTNGEADYYQLTIMNDDKVVETRKIDKNDTSYTLADLKMGATYSVTLEVIVEDEVMESKTRSVGFYVPDKVETYTVNQDTSYNGDKIQADCLMIGRGRVAMVQFDIEDLGGIASAQLSLSQIRGTNSPIAVFLMPNNDWKEDDANYTPNKYYPIADSGKTLRDYSITDRESVFPAYTASSGDDATPTEEEQLKVLQSAASGSLSEFFYGDYATTSAIANKVMTIDVTGAVTQAKQNGSTTVTMLLITPYGFSATFDLWGKDTVWSGTAVTEEQQPKLTVAYAQNSNPDVEYRLGDVDNNGTIELRDALGALQICVATVTDDEKEQQPFLSADIDKDGIVSTNDVLKILQKVNGKDIPELNWES